MTAQQLVSPEQIEPELLRIWEALAKENKMRASLFNLIVFSRLSSRTDYMRNIVQKVVEKFPCRTLFISFDSTSSKSYLKTAVSVVIPQIGESSIACDQIDIGVAGADVEKVPFLLLPHFLPDLPIYLLWAEDPSHPHPLFFPLAKLASRVIFDSESADHLLSFAQKLLALKSEMAIDIADLNWARTEGWRDLISSLFNSEEHLPQLETISSLKLTYNASETPFFCHLKIQAMYLLAWLASRLQWKCRKATKTLHFEFSKEKQRIEVLIQPEQWKDLGPGTILSAELITKDQMVFQAKRLPDLPHSVNIELSSPEQCELPYQFILGQTAMGQSLAKEVIAKGTSSHYLDMLKELVQIDKDEVC